MKIKNDSITFDTTDLSQTACTSQGFNLSHIANFAFQAVTTGAPVGVFKVQVSCDAGQPSAASEAQQVATVTNWSDLPNATVAVSASGTHLINVVDAGYNWARIVYTKTSGTGAISSARCNFKGI